MGELNEIIGRNDVKLLADIAIIYGVGLVCKTLYQRQERAKNSSVRYERVDILTETELQFYKQMKLAVKNDIMCKVRLADIARPVAGSGREWSLAMRQHVDFAVLDGGRVIAVIELDDASHLTSKARSNDGVKNRALSKAGIKIIRVQVARTYNTEGIAAAINKVAI